MPFHPQPIEAVVAENRRLSELGGAPNLSSPSVLSRALSAIRGWQERRHLAVHLGAMSDHLLADIGLRRSDIPDVFGVYPASGSWDQGPVRARVSRGTPSLPPAFAWQHAR